MASGLGETPMHVGVDASLSRIHRSQTCLHSRCHYSDLQDVCIAIGSLATLDLPMVVDRIVIYGLKGPYRTLTTADWFLQALSVIPRGSWGDVARRSYHDPMGKSGIMIPEPQCRLPSSPHTPPPPRAAGKSFPANLDEENPSAQISSGLLVQADEGVSHPVVDLIGVIYRSLP
ncbi:plasma membrane ATPase 1-like [Dorcoceras hygrometricum]|uniref:Plasma membrane ATPase 1-like n=1 Tax=Dorcoceras hygrometricum TaxID=472368 RepID=A0A2Z7AVV5_9LAMI|nr:plasma membrane ATPase 1-like [Dorcoceras hygrometricum]